MTDYKKSTLSQLKQAAQGPNSEAVLRLIALEAISRLETDEKVKKVAGK
jgi:hypothetical protein